MRVNLNSIIKHRNIDRTELAKVLFPGNKHQSQALARLLSRNVPLKEQQLYRLAIYCGVSVDSLYSEALGWKHSQIDKLVRFTRDEYIAIYSIATGITKIYHLESYLATHTLSSNNQTMEDYLSEINRIITDKSIRT